MIRIRTDARAIALATAFAHRFARCHRIAADPAARLAIVIEELVTNLVEHGGAPDGVIDLRLVRLPGGIEITLVDGGIHFHPRTAVTSLPSSGRGGGAGLALVLAWATVVDYRREAGRNWLDLVMPA